MDKTTSIGYCSSPYSPQPHNGIKLVSSANIPAKENKAKYFHKKYGLKIDQNIIYYDEEI